MFSCLFTLCYQRENGTGMILAYWPWINATYHVHTGVKMSALCHLSIEMILTNEESTLV
jgi:hypothetical protein